MSDIGCFEVSPANQTALLNTNMLGKTKQMSCLLNACIHRSNFILHMCHSLCFGEKGPFEADWVKSHVLF